MMDPFLEVLFQSDFWATRQMLLACGQLTQEQFERPLGLGHGNLERTIAHLLGAMMFFTDRLNRIKPGPRPDREGRVFAPADLPGLFDSIEGEFYQAIERCAQSHVLSDPLNWTNDDSGPVDPDDQITYAVALAQMLDHAIHHRTQAMDMLRLLGVEGPMDWHPFEWEESVRKAS